MSRFDYVKYDALSISRQDRAKLICRDLEDLICELFIADDRSVATALYKLEECYAWIGKSIRDHQICRNGSAELQEERKDG